MYSICLSLTLEILYLYKWSYTNTSKLVSLLDSHILVSYIR